MSDWQPIETAPKGEVRIILSSPYRGPMHKDDNPKGYHLYAEPARVGEGLWTCEVMGGVEGWHWANDSCSCCWEPIPVPPTHWMPLPPPPT